MLEALRKLYGHDAMFGFFPLIINDILWRKVLKI